MKTILVPVDFTTYSSNALDFAYELAKKHGDANIRVLHVIESMEPQELSVTGDTSLESNRDLYINLMIQGVERQMEAIVNDEKYADVEIIPHVHRGKPYESIAESVTEHDAFLVVMGTLGSSGLDELFIGSNTEKVVRFAKCPVLAIPQGAKFTDIKNVVYATNLTEKDNVVINRLKQGQKLFGAHLHILWVHSLKVLESDEVMKERLQEFAVRNELENYSLHISKGIFPEAGIMNYADEIDADMIALTTGGRTGISYLFSGSLAESVVNHSCRPVWTYNGGF